MGWGSWWDVWDFIVDHVLPTTTAFQLWTLPTSEALEMSYRRKCSRARCPKVEQNQDALKEARGVSR